MATDAENHESLGFNFGRQSNSTYKFTRIRKNLDLFVMERNERHLTSLHLNWQKLSKTDETAGPDMSKTENCFTPSISSPDNTDRRIDPKLRPRTQSRHKLQEIPPGVAHEDFEMTVKGNETRSDSPYVTSTISDKIKAIKNQLSELNEEIDSKIANPDLDLEAEQDELPPAYTFSNSEVILIKPTLPQECLPADQGVDRSSRSTDGFIHQVHDNMLDDERSVMRNSVASVEQQGWQPADEFQARQRSPSPNKCDVASSNASGYLRKLDEEYVQKSRSIAPMEYSPELRGKSHYTMVDMSHQSREFGVRTGDRYQAISPVSPKKTMRSSVTGPELKDRRHSRDFKPSDSPEIKQSLPFCRHSMDSMQDSTLSLTHFSDTSSDKAMKANTATTRRKNSGFRRSSHRVTNSAQKNDLEVFPESEKDSGCQPGYGRESASTQWRSNLSGKKSGSYGKKHGMDSTVSISQVRNRFLDEDKNSQGDVLEDIDYEGGAVLDSPSPIPKPLILEKDEGTISEISGDFLNEKAERDKFSNNDSSEIWTEKRAESKRSLLEGLGTSYCVVPNFIWKYIGQDTDDEPMTRKKCIAFILGAILVVILITLLLGLIIGIATSISPEEFSPIRFTVIPGLPEGDENPVGDTAPE